MDEIENAKHVIDIWQLGQTSAKHETGGRGSATISTGLGDHGGVSYGTYQLSTKMGTVQKFVNLTRYKEDFSGLMPGTPAFDAKWRELATMDQGFGADQHDFIRQTHYDVQVEKLKNAGIDLSDRGRAVHDALWSTSVQFGGGTSVFQHGLEETFGKNLDLSKLSDEDIVGAVQDYKIEHNKDLFKSSPDLLGGLLKRAQDEKASLIELATKEDLLARNGIDISFDLSKNRNPAVAQHVDSRPVADSVIPRLQASLNALGYTDKDGRVLATDGHYGHSTKQAVRYFQRDHGLSADGIAGPNTLEVLRTQQQMLGRVPAFAPELEGNPQAQRDAIELAHQAPLLRDTQQPIVSAIHASSPTPSLAAATPQAPHEQRAAEAAHASQQAVIDQHIALQQRTAAEERETQRVAEARAAQELAAQEPIVAPAPAPEPAAISPATPPHLDAATIRGLQHQMNTLGMTNPFGQPLPITGTYDIATRAAVMAFQMDQGLPGTGEPDRATRALVEARATIAELQRPERERPAMQPDISGRDEALRPTARTTVTPGPMVTGHAHANTTSILDPDAYNQAIHRTEPGLDDPRKTRNPLHALYNELKTRVPDASENRLLQFTAACHACKITDENLGRIHFDEQRGHIMFTASWPPGPFAEVDVKVPSPEPHQSIERIQHYDQSQAQMMSEIRAQNAQIEAQAQQGLGLGGPMR